VGVSFDSLHSGSCRQVSVQDITTAIQKPVNYNANFPFGFSPRCHRAAKIGREHRFLDERHILPGRFSRPPSKIAQQPRADHAHVRQQGKMREREQSAQEKRANFSPFDPPALLLNQCLGRINIKIEQAVL